MTKVGCKTLFIVIIGIGVTIGLCSGVIAAIYFFDGYVVRGTRPVPGNATQYDPIAAYPQIIQFAGSDQQLLGINMKFVKASGTLDLTTDYGAEVTYSFAHVLDTSLNNAIPLGAGGGTDERYAKLSYVTVSKAGNEDDNDSQYYDFGMENDTMPAAPLAETIVNAPACELKQLWDEALKHDAPKNAVATIVYDNRGYTFSIDGTHLALQFDASCHLSTN